MQRFQTNEKPIVVGHRGCRNGFPENTILAMRRAVSQGAQTIETDIQLAKDGIVVHCHDVTTGRCFNKNFDVEQTEFKGKLDQLVSKDQYKEKMPTLSEVAKMFILDPEFAEINLMLDIKRSNRPHVVPYVLKTLLDVAPIEVWEKRCTFGVWKSDVMAAVHELAPTISVTFIGIEHRTAKHFITTWPSQVKNISVSYFSYASPGGPQLIEFAREKNVNLYSWTVNDPEAMKWAVASRLNGVITDYPDIFNNFLNSISENDMLQEYFVSEPRSFYPLWFMWSMWSMYYVGTAYLLMADNLPWLFRRY